MFTSNIFQAKCTYGTGAFMLYNVGPRIVHSEHGLLSTVAYKLGKHQVWAHATHKQYFADDILIKKFFKTLLLSQRVNLHQQNVFFIKVLVVGQRERRNSKG